MIDELSDFIRGRIDNVFTEKHQLDVCEVEVNGIKTKMISYDSARETAQRAGAAALLALEHRNLKEIPEGLTAKLFSKVND